MADSQKAPSRADRVRSTVLIAWSYAAVYSIVAVLLFGGSKGPGQFHFSLGEVVAVYWLSATILGLIVGILRPFGTTPGRRFAIAFLGSWPAVLGIYAIANQKQFTEVDRLDLAIAAALAAVYSAYAATQESF